MVRTSRFFDTYVTGKRSSGCGVFVEVGGKGGKRSLPDRSYVVGTGTYRTKLFTRFTGELDTSTTGFSVALFT